MKTKNGLYVYIKNSFQISRVELFWFSFNFRNKFIKQFAINKDRFFKLWLKKFLEERSHLCKSQTLEPTLIEIQLSNVLFLFYVFCL